MIDLKLFKVLFLGKDRKIGAVAYPREHKGKYTRLWGDTAACSPCCKVVLVLWSDTALIVATV